MKNHPVLSDEGVEAIEKVYHWLRAGAPHKESNGGAFSMSRWRAEMPKIVSNKEETFYSDDLNKCGTVLCIGGAVQQFENTFSEYDTYLLLIGEDDYDKKELLHSLFFPEGYEEAWNATPSEAADVLRHFLDTGEVDWGIPFEKGEDDG